MLRRTLFGLPLAAFAAQRPDAGTDSFVAGASEDATPRVAVVPSSFKGSEDHDGTPLKGLSKPSPPDAVLDASNLEEMLARAIEFGNTRGGDLASMIEDSVVIKPQMRVHRDAAGRLVAGAVADPRIVRALMKWLATNTGCKRITIAEAPAVSGAFNIETFDWDGCFGKTTYRGIVAEFAREYPKIQCNIVDLRSDKSIGLQTPDRAGSSGPGEYKVAATLIQARRLITVAPLATSAATGVSLTLGSYLNAMTSPAPSGPVEQVVVDLFSFRPPDHAIVGGEWALEGGDPQSPGAASVRHNVIVGGASAIAVDAAAAGVMGFEPARIPHLELAARRGFGTIDLDSIWVRGNEISEAKRAFRPAASISK